MADPKSNIKEIKRNGISVFLSVVIHIIILLIAFFAKDILINKPLVNSSFLHFETFESESKVVEDYANENAEETKDETLEKVEENIQPDFYNSFVKTEADTTDLDQLYTEKTLNVSIKYPKGWVYLDQNKKRKLEGVTFWSLSEKISPPPYIHLEVSDKDLFIESRYQYKLAQEDCYWYFNEPEKMENTITQEIYIRTESDEDFKIKLMIQGEENYKNFRPKFMAIIKSFEFDSGIF